MRLFDLNLEEKIIWVSFSYDPELVNLVKTIRGRKYDAPNKKWSVPLSSAHELVAAFEDRQFKYSPSFRDYLEDLPERPAVESSSENASDPKALTVSQLNFQAQNALRGQLPFTLLLDGEVDGLSRNKKVGHAYFDLLDRPSGGAPLAKVSAVCFAAARSRISGRLARVGNKIVDGGKYRFIVKPELYTKQGQFQVVIEDIEMEAVFSKAKQRRDAALKILRDEKIIHKNLDIELPICPLKIGLISSMDSDAYNDFIHELEVSPYNFQLEFYPAKMQGVDASQSLSKAIQRFEKKDVDVLAIVRGGGAKSSLADLDSIEVGRAVCELKTKVICGIGHHLDQGVLDEISLGKKTPTAAAQFLVERVRGYLEKINRLASKLAFLSAERVASESYYLENLSEGLGRRVLDQTRGTQWRLDRLEKNISSASNYYLRRHVEENERISEELQHLVGRHHRRQEQRVNNLQRRLEKLPLHRQLERARGKVNRGERHLEDRSKQKLQTFRVALNHLEKQLEWMKPHQTLARGYAILRKEKEIIKSVEKIKVGDTLSANLRDGSLDIKVTKIVKKEN